MSVLSKSIRNGLRRVSAHYDHWRQILVPSGYNEELFAVMRRILRRDSSCIDVGCHRGVILKEMLKFAPHGEHHAFEALPHLAARLTQEYPQATIHAVAVADHVGEAEFLHVQDNPGFSGLRRRWYNWPDPQIVPIRVKVTTIDESVPNDVLVSLMKIDIEGGEYHAICGAKKLIRRSRPYIAFEAANGSTGEYGITGEAMYDLLDGLDYDLTTMKRWLSRRGFMTISEYAANWNGPDFFWLAVPRC
jgi:FkbM family methyltransferase